MRAESRNCRMLITCTASVSSGRYLSISAPLTGSARARSVRNASHKLWRRWLSMVGYSKKRGELGHFHCFVGIEAPAPQVSEILWLSSRFEKQAGSRYHGPDGDSALVYFSSAAVCAGPRWRWGT